MSSCIWQALTRCRRAMWSELEREAIENAALSAEDAVTRGVFDESDPALPNDDDDGAGGGEVARVCVRAGGASWGAAWMQTRSTRRCSRMNEFEEHSNKTPERHGGDSPPSLPRPRLQVRPRR